MALDSQGKATGRLYHDAGEGFSYRTGDFRLATLEAKGGEGAVTIRLASAVGKRKAPVQTVQVILVGKDGSQAVAGQGCF